MSNRKKIYVRVPVFFPHPFTYAGWFDFYYHARRLGATEAEIEQIERGEIPARLGKLWWAVSPAELASLPL